MRSLIAIHVTSKGGPRRRRWRYGEQETLFVVAQPWNDANLLLVAGPASLASLQFHPQAVQKPSSSVFNMKHELLARKKLGAQDADRVWWYSGHPGPRDDLEVLLLPAAGKYSKAEILLCHRTSFFTTGR